MKDNPPLSERSLLLAQADNHAKREETTIKQWLVRYIPRFAHEELFLKWLERLILASLTCRH